MSFRLLNFYGVISNKPTISNHLEEGPQTKVNSAREVTRSKLSIVAPITLIASATASLYAGLYLLSSLMELNDKQPLLNLTFSLFMSYKMHSFTAPQLFNEMYLRLISQVAKSFEVGNCGEHAYIALEHLKKMSTLNGEVIADFANDHAFLVIDRDPDSSISDPKTWGDRAVVCDPWARQAFKAYELEKKLSHILATHLYPPMTSLSKSNFQLEGSYSTNIFLSQTGNIFSTVLCSNLHLESVLKAITNTLEGLKEITSQVTSKSFSYPCIQTT